MPDFSEAAPVVPIAGLLIGGVPACILLGGRDLYFSAPLAVPLALLGLVVVTGALHEDGLADCADGFGGGRSREQKLEIMKDSRIGTYGALAVVFSLYLRGAALTALSSSNIHLAAAACAVSGGLSRSLALLPLALLPPARGTGAGFAGQGLKMKHLTLSLGLAFLVSLAPVLAGMSLVQNLAATACAGLTVLGILQLAKVQIGGQTGDVAGAAQNLSEIVFFLILAARL